MIGILGGTFDPVHFGHLRPALEARQALGLDEIRLIPCNVPPHRPQPFASARQRLTMLQGAIAGHAGFVIDERELHRDGPSYTLDTLLSLHADIKGVDLCLLLGMDAFRGLTSWHRWHELIDHCHIVVMTRPDATFPERGELGTFIGLHRVLDPAVLRMHSTGCCISRRSASWRSPAHIYGHCWVGARRRTSCCLTRCWHLSGNRTCIQRAAE